MKMLHLKTDVNVVPDNDPSSNVFCCAALVDASQGGPFKS